MPCLGTGFSLRRAPATTSARRAVRVRYGRPVRLIKATAKCIGLEFADEKRHDDSREEAFMLWGTEKCQLQVDWKCGTHLHLPVGHVMHAILDAMEDAVDLQRQHM